MATAARATSPLPSPRDPFAAFVSFAPSTPAADGPLAGVRLAVKDMVDLAGHASSCGLPGAPGAVAATTAPVLARLLAAGARLVGFTRMTPLAYEPSGANPAQGRPLNPWSAAHICGGSSSGSAVAVASGLADLALGTDTAGSLRIPAHCCGISAWKPGPDLVPRAGTLPLAPSLDAIGFLARGADRLAAVAALFAQRSACAPARRVTIASDLAARSSPQVAGAVRQFATDLERIGIAAVGTTLQDMIDACDGPTLDLLQGEAARIHADRLAAGRIEPVLARRLAKGAEIDEARLAEARARLARLAAGKLETVLGDADAILLPVMPIATPEVAQCEPGDPAFSPRTLYALSAWTRFVNGLGLPAVALPAGMDGDGLPIGLQLVGRRGSDLALLGIAVAIQEISPWHQRTAPGVAP